MKNFKTDNISAILELAAHDRDYEFWLMQVAIDKIRTKYSAYIWCYPISYHDDKGNIHKQTFGWDIEFSDCTIKQYNQELPTYHDAMKDAIIKFNEIIQQ